MVSLCSTVCLCVRKRERERNKHTHTHSQTEKPHIKEVQQVSLCGTCFTSRLPGSTINLAGTTSPLPSRISTIRLTWDRLTGFTSFPIYQVSPLCVDEVRFWHVVLQQLGHSQGTGLNPQYLNNVQKKVWFVLVFSCCVLIHYVWSGMFVKLK